MQVINKLTKPGEIKCVVLRENEVIVTTQDQQQILYKRSER